MRAVSGCRTRTERVFYHDKIALVHLRMQNVLRMQQAIIEEYKVDMLKYAPQADKSRIRECFESIPRQLSKENKKFAYATVRFLYESYCREG